MRIRVQGKRARPHRFEAMIPGFLVCGIILTKSFGQPPAAAETPSARAMRAIADGVELKRERGRATAPVGRFAQPVYRFQDPARRFSDGTVWAWGRDGRPVAFLTVAANERRGVRRWVCELTALSDERVSASVVDEAEWKPPAGSGIDRQAVPEAAAPAADESGRLRQMKELARRLEGFEFYAAEGETQPQRYELRLLPLPIVRYADPDARLVDGAIFFFVYGNNPEIVLLIEARGASAAKAQWSYGFSRIAGAELRVMRGDQEIWSEPATTGADPRASYHSFVRRFIDPAP
jgi:hypothetical protein